MAKAMYAWSDLYGGGDTKELKRPDGRVAVVVEKRNITPRGEKVTQSGLKVDDATWDSLIAGGSVRPYPVPEEANEWVSPASAALSRISKGGDVDTNVLLELAMQHPPAMNPPAEEAAELPEGT